MFLACAIVSLLLAAVLAGSASGKLAKASPVVENLSRARVPLSWYPGLAALELAGAAGLAIGLAVEALGIAAATGVVAYFVGAVAAHVRAGDTGGVVPPVALLGWAIAALALRATTI